jgi:murein DD-endopeptidase MepM/ murein hydrolase activator NlpD
MIRMEGVYMYYNNQFNRFNNNNRKTGRGFSVKFARQLGFMLIVFLFLLLLKFVNNEKTSLISSKIKDVFYSDFTEEATDAFKSRLGESGDFLDNLGKNVEDDFFIETLPVQGDITKGFGKFINEATKKEELHNGIEIKVKEGAEVKSVFDGVVESIESDSTKGFVVVIKHDSGYKTLYRYLKDCTLSEDDIIKKGQLIGTCGKIGKEESIKLYFELSRNDITEDPQKYMKAITN